MESLIRSNNRGNLGDDTLFCSSDCGDVLVEVVARAHLRKELP